MKNVLSRLQSHLTTLHFIAASVREALSVTGLSDVQAERKQRATY